MIHVIGGGTQVPVRNHFSLSAPAYGDAARTLHKAFESAGQQSTLHLTRMADSTSRISSNQDVQDLVDNLVQDSKTRVIVMTAAMCDWVPVKIETPNGSQEDLFGSHAERLRTADGSLTLHMAPAPKVIDRIRKGDGGRKDVFLVACKTTTGATEQEQYLRALHLLKASSANLVLANDTVTRLNMIVVPEEARYHVTHDRQEVLKGLAEMTLARSKLHFTRSTVVGSEADLVPWSDARVPSNLRAVVDHCIARGAYQPFRGRTAGHFAVNMGGGEFLSSIRSRNYNNLAQVGLVQVKAVDADTVVARGARPSVGGQSQRIVFAEHPEFDCIVHAHVPLRVDAPDRIQIQDQRPYECGSHECGKNTSNGLTPHRVEGDVTIKAVMLDNHGPNVIFRRDTPPEAVIAFMERNFDLTQKTGGPTHSIGSVG